jgi:outer membrane protein assembly factor BamB
MSVLSRFQSPNSRILSWALLPLAAAAAFSACGDDDGNSGGEAGGPDADWPMYGFDYANSVNNQSEDALSSENVSGIQEVWRLDGIGGVTGTPAIVDGVVYFGDWTGWVRAVRSSDGSVVWEEHVGDAPISASVAVSEDVVVAGDLAGGTLYCLDRETGSVRWSVLLDPLGASLWASPVVIEDSVVIGLADDELTREPGFRASVVALSLEDGSEQWRTYTDPGEDDAGTFVPLWSSVAYDPDRGLVYIGTGNTNVVPSRGTPPGSDRERSPTDLPFANGVMAIDRDSGEVSWVTKIIEKDEGLDFDVGASSNLFSIGARDVVGVGGKSGDYAVLDRDSGEVVWKRHLSDGSAIGGVMSTAATGDGVIYVASNAGGPQDGTIFALAAADGSILWQRPFEEPVIGGSLALANGVLYRGVSSLIEPGGTAVALDATDGTVLWTETIDGSYAGGFSVSGGTLYAGYVTVPIAGLRALMPVDGGLIAYGLP